MAGELCYHCCPGVSVAARRLAENSHVQILLAEGGARDEAAQPSVWPENFWTLT
jgi:hypothetical protein